MSLQIRLLNNVGWWYLLPLLPGGLLSFAATSDDGVEFWGCIAFLLLLFGGILWLNLWVACKQLVPQQREVDSLLAALESRGEEVEPATPSSRPEPESPARGTFRFLLVALILACVGWFALEEFGDRARKRFGEDLPELLSKMGHAPAWEVTLELATDDVATELLKTRMTKQNRDLVRDQGSE